MIQHYKEFKNNLMIQKIHVKKNLQCQNNNKKIKKICYIVHNKE